MEPITLQSIAIYVTPAITLAAAVFLWVTQNRKATEVKDQMEQKVDGTFKLLEQKIDATSKLLEQKIDLTGKSLEDKINWNAELLKQSIGKVDALDKVLAEMRATQQSILARLPERDSSARA